MRKMRLGIVLDGRDAEAALIAGGWGGAKLLRAVHVAGQPGCLDPFDAGDVAALFAGIARQMPAAARRADVDCLLCLPEPLVHEDVLEFVTFPEDGVEANLLVGHRVARENWLEAGDLVTSHAVLARGEGDVTVRVRWMRRDLRDGLEQAAAKAGLRPVRIDGWSGYIEAAPGMKAARDRALFWSDGNSWMLLCQSGPAEDLIDSGWVGDGAVGAVAEKVLRLVRSYMHRQSVTDLPLLIEAPQEVSAAFQPLAGGPPIAAARLDDRLANSAARVASWR